MKIYIVLTYTGTLLSRVIKTFKRSQFAHVSISLDEDLKEMYSFGRLNAYNAFIGGFVHESLSSGTFKRFQNTRALVLEVNVNETKYNKIRKIIEKFKKNKNAYRFNIIGLALTAVHIRFKQKNRFYCTEFVKYLLDEAKYKHDLPSFTEPDDFIGFNNGKVVYKGLLKNYDESETLAQGS